jgi:predicted 2-oxoglutarate/Fe(II)-dependent dioxygenase YbiX
VLAGPTGAATRFYATAGGRPTALVFGRGAEFPQRAELAALLAARDDVSVIEVLEAAAAEAYGVPANQPTVVVLDPDLRLVGTVHGDDPGTAVVTLLEQVIHRDPAIEIRGQAPVLFVPRVLDAALRDRLIEHAERDAVETGVERSSGAGRGDVLDADFKRRRDHTVADAALLRELSSVIGHRVLPEVTKAFAFRATRFEGFKLACYSAATGGFFRSHRDNLSPSTAHRVFALTLNLNDEYDGGQLRFPEYGNQLYRPDAGVALVFSCAHLHEVLDVTAGRRFVLLSFLYGEPADSPSPRPTQV